VPTPAARELARQLEASRDEIEVLEAQLAVKRAQVLAAQITLKDARAELERLRRLAGTRSVPGLVSPQDLDKAQTQVSLAEVQLRIKEAELKEPEVRLRQARRRLEELQGDSGPQAGAKGADGGAALVCTPTFRDLGPVRRGTVMTSRFRLVNRSRFPVKITNVRFSSAALVVTSPPRQLEPGEKAYLDVSVDTGRFVGPKVFTIYLTLSRPEVEELRLQVRADSQEEPANPAKAQQSPDQRRFQDLQKKLDTLQKEMDDLRQQLRRQQSSSGAKGLPPDIMVINQRRFRVPISVDSGRRRDIRRIGLYASRDQGRTWQLMAEATPDADAFTFEAPADGLYWLSVVVTDRKGRPTPLDLPNSPPGLKVLVNTAGDSPGGGPAGRGP
jgi:hypothetical protein